MKIRETMKHDLEKRIEEVGYWRERANEKDIRIQEREDEIASFQAFICTQNTALYKLRRGLKEIKKTIPKNPRLPIVCEILEIAIKTLKEGE